MKIRSFLEPLVQGLRACAQTILVPILCSVVLLATVFPGFAAEVSGPASWHPQSLVEAGGHMLVFAFVGVIAAIVGYKLFDKCTPGELHREILENRNTAAAVVAAAVILGVCLIVAAAIVG